MRWIFLLSFLGAFAAPAQKIGENAPLGSTPTATFTAGAQLVVETVAVADKKGAPVQGLTAKDFTVTEDGVPQTIRLFEYQSLPEAAIPAASAPHAPGQIQIYDKLGRSQISSESPGQTRYKDRRLLALYFDMTAMPPADQLRALEAARNLSPIACRPTS